MDTSEALNSPRTNAGRSMRPMLGEAERNQPAALETATPLSVVASSLLFSVLQSMCTAVVALNSVRLAIGIGSLAMTTGLGAAMEQFHQISVKIVLPRGDNIDDDDRYAFA